MSNNTGNSQVGKVSADVRNETGTRNNHNASLDNYTKNGFKTVTEAIRHSNALPAERDWDFHILNESFSNAVNNEGDRILRLINTILRKYEVEENIRNRGIDEKTELIVEANDTILERVGDNIDEMNGIKKKTIAPVEFQTVSAQLPINGSWNRINKATFSVSSSLNSPFSAQSNTSRAIHLLTGKNIVRPQKFFKDKIDNSNYPWEPRITEKPNSIKPLALYLEETEFGETFCHPYEIELQQFTPPPEQLKRTKPVKPLLVSNTPLHEISTVDELNELLVELYKHTEFSVDLEHHSYRTFMGITCLMQISTKDADYLIDALKLRDKLHILNEVFTKPSIVKIFHGADSDIVWLQRDLSLYVVNLFDTHQAAKQLGYSTLSLAYLLNKFCKLVPNKQFQLADWRIRPLPDELKSYAREDTHYLIYIYHMLKNELLKQGNGSENILKSVIQRSTEICKKRYYKPILREESHIDFYRKCKRLFDNRQMHALKGLYQWRDKIARAEDESTGYVLPNHMLLQISEMLPREMQGIMACCNPIPPLVRSNLLQLHQIVLHAREQSVEKPIMKEDNRDRGSTQQFSKLNVDSPLHCPHDLTKQQEFRDDLPTLLQGAEIKAEGDSLNFPDLSIVKEEVTIQKQRASVSVFDSCDDEEGENGMLKKISDLIFLGPYERYKLVKPYIQAEEEKGATAPKNANEKETGDTTNEDRIASLHQHFVQVAKATPQKIHIAVALESVEDPDTTIPLHSKKPVQPLSSMGGSRKRKRNQFETPTDYHPAYETPENQLHTPVPNINKRKRFKRPKNQANENNYFQNNKKYKNADKTNQTQSRNGITQPNTISKKKRNRDAWLASQLPSTKGKGGNKFKKNQNSQGAGENPRGRKFTAFDYSTVDFQHFQGGAGSGNNNVKVETKFKGKNKNRTNAGKRNNKYSTFSNRKSKGGFKN